SPVHQVRAGVKPGPIFPVPQRPFDDATASGPAALAIREDTHNSYLCYYGFRCIAKQWLASNSALELCWSNLGIPTRKIVSWNYVNSNISWPLPKNCILDALRRA